MSLQTGHKTTNQPPDRCLVHLRRAWRPANELSHFQRAGTLIKTRACIVRYGFSVQLVLFSLKICSARILWLAQSIKDSSGP